MKKLALSVLLLSSCAIAGDIEDQCKAAADEAVEQCQTEVDGLKDELQTWKDELQAWIDDLPEIIREAISDAIDEWALRAGCTRDGSPLGWNCYGTQVCDPPLAP